MDKNTEQADQLETIMLSRIRELLKDRPRGSQKELAEFLGFKNSNVITDWLGGKNKSYRQYGPQIAEFFDVSLDYLVGITDDKNKKPVINNDDELKVSQEEAEFLKIWRLVPGDRRAVLSDLIIADLKSKGLL